MKSAGYGALLSKPKASTHARVYREYKEQPILQPLAAEIACNKIPPSRTLPRPMQRDCGIGYDGTS